MFTQQTRPFTQDALCRLAAARCTACVVVCRLFPVVCCLFELVMFSKKCLSHSSTSQYVLFIFIFVWLPCCFYSLSPLPLRLKRSPDFTRLVFTDTRGCRQNVPGNVSCVTSVLLGVLLTQSTSSCSVMPKCPESLCALCRFHCFILCPGQTNRQRRLSP